MAQENISVQLNDLLASRDFQAELLDREGRPTDAENADIFTFDFVSSSRKNYGTMVIILDADNEMQVFYGDNLGRSMEGDDKTEFFDFVQHLHKFANMRRWTYSPKNINQVKYTMQGLAAIKEGLFEGYYGTRRVSYSGEPTEARLVIQHNRALGETDARFRYVESLFIETADAERFRLQFKNLAGGRAMLEHVRQGGKPYDVRGSHITEMVSEIATLSRFNRASAGRVLEGVTAELVTEAQQYYRSLRENLKRLGGTRGYQTYFESWHPAETTLQEELVDSIKTMFVEQTLDSRIEAALPVLARLQQENRMKEADIFESWAEHLSEGTWSLPETPEQQQRLQDLMSRELIVGPDATNATQQLDDLVGDDILFDRLSDLASRDASANVWDDTDVQARLAELGIQLPAEAPADPAVDATAQQPVADPAAGPAGVGSTVGGALAKEGALSDLPRPNKRNQFRSLHKLRKQRGLGEQGVAETALKDKEDLAAKRRALQDLSRNPGVDQKAVQQRQRDLEKEARSRGLVEGWKNTNTTMLTESRTYKLWESAGHKLVEAQLTVDQINQIFQQIQQNATAAGDNRTMIGKGKDATVAIKKAYDDLVTKVQSSGPVKGADAMYDSAVAKIEAGLGGPDNAVNQVIQKYRKFAKENPVAQSLIYSILIAAAGISGVGLGGAAVLGLLKMTDKLLQGEKFSTAVGKGLATGALAYGAGQLGQAIKGQPAVGGDAAVQSATNTSDVASQASIAASRALRQEAQTVALKAAQDAIAGGIDPSHTSRLTAAVQAAIEQYGTNVGGKLHLTTLDAIANKAAVVAGRAAEGGMNESRKLSESQIYLVIGNIVDRQRKLDEGVMDTIKGAAGKAVDYIKTKGTNLTTKVTADKLLQAWKKAKSPTDSLDVAKVIQNAGVPSATIKQVYGTMNIPFPSPTAAQPAAPAAQPAAPAAQPAAPAAPAAQPAAPAAQPAAPAAPAAQPAVTTAATKPLPLATSTTGSQPHATAQPAPAPAAVAKSAAGTVPAPAFNASNVMSMPGMEKYAKPVTPSYAGPSAYGKTTMGFKSPTATPAKAKNLAESLLTEFAEDLDSNDAVKTHKGGIVTKTAHGIKHTKTNYQDGTPGEPGVKSSGKESQYKQTPILDKDDDLDEYQTNEASGCNHTMEGEMCPKHGLAECGMHESQVAESQEGDALLARIKSLALLR